MIEQQQRPLAPHEVLVFVYGSLLRGEVNHGYMSGARFVGGARTRAAYGLFDLGAYPAMVTGGETSIRGEVYACDRMLLTRLDELEDHPDFFRRTSIELEDGSLIQAYLLPGVHATFYPRISSGDWRGRGGDASS